MIGDFMGISLNHPACPVCGATKSVSLCAVNGYEVWRCIACSSDFVWPQPGSVELKAYYDNETYFSSEISGSYGDYDADTEPVIPLFRELLTEFGEASNRSILDIGCAYGTHLAIAADNGWIAVGVELSDHARKVAMSRHGDRISVYPSLEEVPGKEFDVISLFDVIEHLPNPFELMKSLIDKGFVGKQTKILLTTPNARSSHAVAKPKEWPYRYPPAHLIYFSARSLLHFWARLDVDNVEVRGIYPTEQFDNLSYEDEKAGINDSVVKCEGLLCVASKIDLSYLVSLRDLGSRISVLYRVLPVLDYGAEVSECKNLARDPMIRRLSVELQNLYSDLFFGDGRLGGGEHPLVKMSVELTRSAKEELRLRGELDLLGNEMRALRQTKWFRLREALTERPVSIGSIMQAVRLIASILLPKSIRALLAKVRSPKAHQVLSQQPPCQPYVVRASSPNQADRRRIVHVIANFMTGGSSRLVVDLIEYLGHSYEQSVVTSFIPSPPAYVGLNIVELRVPENEQEFVKTFGALRPELIHVHYWGDVDESWYANAISAAVKMNIPVVENINTPVIPYFSPIIKRYVYVSDYVRKVFGREGAEHMTIYPGSDFFHFNRDADDNLPENCIGMVYRLERDKLNEAAIQPFILAVKKRPQTRVLIVGGGSLLSVFQQAVADAGVYGNFEFTGYVSYSELPEMYRRMSIFVAPVWKESFGQVSPFAMSMAIPVCGYDIGAIGEIVDDTSLVAPRGDADALADIMIRLLDSPDERLRIGKRQQARAQEFYSVEAMIRSYADLYKVFLSSAA